MLHPKEGTGNWDLFKGGQHYSHYVTTEIYSMFVRRRLRTPLVLENAGIPVVRFPRSDFFYMQEGVRMRAQIPIPEVTPHAFWPHSDTQYPTTVVDTLVRHIIGAKRFIKNLVTRGNTRGLERRLQPVPDVREGFHITVRKPGRHSMETPRT